MVFLLNLQFGGKFLDIFNVSWQHEIGIELSITQQFKLLADSAREDIQCAQIMFKINLVIQIVLGAPLNMLYLMT